MNIFQLEILAAVVKYGTFSDAAAQLEISQSAVSRAIASLESELGCCCFLGGGWGQIDFGGRAVDAPRLLNVRPARADRL